MKKSFTIVTPNYNMGYSLAETIESVLRNKGPEDKYFVIDGGSSDNSLEIIQRYDSKLDGWVSEPDRGYADAVAKGFRLAKSDYQCWINCGDLLLPGALDEARSRLETHHVDLVFGDDFYIDEKGRVLQISNGCVGDLAAMMLYGGWTPLQDACFWRSSLYEKVGGIDPERRYAADYDLFLRMSLAGTSQYVPVVFSAFRRHKGQTSALYAEEYQRERENCRQRELLAVNIGALKRLALGAFFWLKVRLRARMNTRNRKLDNLVGADVATLSCVNFGGGR